MNPREEGSENFVIGDPEKIVFFFGSLIFCTSFVDLAPYMKKKDASRGYVNILKLPAKIAIAQVNREQNQGRRS